jgi:PRTRC genetic system protein E
MATPAPQPPRAPASLRSPKRDIVEGHRRSLHGHSRSSSCARRKDLTVIAFRNGPLEDLHAGKICPYCNGDQDYSHVTEPEMKQLMQAAVNAVTICSTNANMIPTPTHGSKCSQIATPETGTIPSPRLDIRGGLMFRELAPYLRHRSVLFTVTHLGDDDQIRVNIVPTKLKDGENEALTTPLSVTGTAEELDAELPKTIVDYVGAHLQLRNSLDNAKALMDAAAKTAQEEAQNKAKAAPKTGKANPGAQSTAITTEPAKPVEAAKPAVPKTFGLFDTPEPASTSHADEEADILAEVNEPEDDDADELEDAA